MRAEGRPSSVAVARIMAFGSWRSASMTFSNQLWNWIMGSGSRSDLSSPAFVYSLRRFEASMGYLPAPGAWGAFERTDYVGGDPTPVEVPFLRLDLLVHVLEPRWTRVIPDRLLSPTRLFPLAAHENLLGSDL